MENDFETDVWPLLLNMFQHKKDKNEPIETSVGDEKHTIRQVSKNRILFRTDKTSNEHWVAKGNFERGWKMLKRGADGGTDFRGSEGSVNYVAKASFGYLPNVEYEVGPQNKRKWYLVDKETHDLGTRKKH